MKRTAIILTLILAQTLLYAQTSWKTVASEKGRFCVTMPGEATERVEKRESAIGTVEVNLRAYEENDAVYLVAWSDYPETAMQGLSDAAFLDKAADGIIAELKGKIISRKKVKLDGREVVEFKAAIMGGECYYIARLYKVGARLYQVVVNAAKTHDYKLVEEFFTSFTIVQGTPAMSDAENSEGSR